MPDLDVDDRGKSMQAQTKKVLQSKSCRVRCAEG